MDKDFEAKMKQSLTEEKDSLQKELDSVSSPDAGDHVPGERAPKFPNFGDDALGENTESPAEVAQYAVNVNVTGTLESKLKKVTAALERIDSGNYGVCTNCGNAISEERLKADPSAEHDITCAKSHVK